MASLNFTDFYILYNGHPRYTKNEVYEDEIIGTILQKYEMILFTNKGDVLGDPHIGCNLLELLHETKVSEQYIIGVIDEQISMYIPEILNTDYKLDVVFMQDPNNYQDMMFINFKIRDYDVYAQIGY